MISSFFLILALFIVGSLSKNFYEILGVKRDATQKEIKKAFHGLSKKHHPDHGVGEKEKEKKHKIMREITEAYATISDVDKRKKYDISLDDPFSQRRGEGGRAHYGSPGASTFSFNGGDMFSSFFGFPAGGFGGGGPNQRGGRQGFDFNFGGGFGGMPRQEPRPQPRTQTKPTTKPTSKSTTRPTAKPTSKPTTKPTAKPTTKTTSKPTTKPTAKPTTKTTSKPTTKPTAKPSTKTQTK
jgi:DnaJ-class molecular chaperone